MSNLRTASLVLKTSDLPASSINEDYSSMTWKNVNLRTLLGDMYDDYDIFNLCLISISSTLPTNPITLGLDKNLQLCVQISGLPFINQTYNAVTGHNETKKVIGTFAFSGTTDVLREFYFDHITTFGKNSDICDITIDYVRISDGLPPVILNEYPDVVLSFNIFGIEKDKKNENATRMKI
jgi:hypothetical protein